MARKQRRLGVKFPLSNTGKGETHVTNNRYHDNDETCQRNPYNRALVSNGFQPENFRFPFFWLLPPVRSYRRGREALLKLNNLSNSGVDKDGYDIRFSVLKSNDTGFEELVALLKEDLLLSGAIHELRILEEQSGIQIGSSSKIAKSLIAITNGAEEVIIYYPFDPTRPLRDLKEMAEKDLRKGLSYAVIVLFVIWVLLALIIDVPSWAK